MISQYVLKYQLVGLQLNIGEYEMCKDKVYMYFSGGILFDKEIIMICSTEDKAIKWVRENKKDYAELHYSEIVLDEMIENGQNLSRWCF